MDLSDLLADFIAMEAPVDHSRGAWLVHDEKMRRKSKIETLEQAGDLERVKELRIVT